MRTNFLPVDLAIDLPREVFPTPGGPTKHNIAPLIFDTMGIFWTMKYPNEKDEDFEASAMENAISSPMN